MYEILCATLAYTIKKSAAAFFEAENGVYSSVCPLSCLIQAAAKVLGGISTIATKNFRVSRLLINVVLAVWSSTVTLYLMSIKYVCSIWAFKIGRNR